MDPTAACPVITAIDWHHVNNVMLVRTLPINEVGNEEEFVFKRVF